MDAHRLLSRVLGLWRCYKNDICYCCGYYCLKVAFIQLSSPLPAQFLSTSTAGLTLLIFFCTRLWPNFCRVKHEAEGATMSGLTSVLRSSSSGGI